MLGVWFRDIDRVEAYVEERIDRERRKLFSGDPDAQAKALSDQVAKLDRKKANYRDQQAEYLISMADLKAVLSQIEDQQAAWNELDKLMNCRQYLEDLGRDKKIALAIYAGHMAAGLDKISPQQRQAAYRRLRLKVSISPGGIVSVEDQPDANCLPEPAELDGWRPRSHRENYASV
jgi:beta-phosphoglucomutase-like phosphatase (HAD superfamily)